MENSLANNVGPDQTPHVASDLGLLCLSITFYGFPGKNGLIASDVLEELSLKAFFIMGLCGLLDQSAASLLLRLTAVGLRLRKPRSARRRSGFSFSPFSSPISAQRSDRWMDR